MYDMNRLEDFTVTVMNKCCCVVQISDKSSHALFDMIPKVSLYQCYTVCERRVSFRLVSFNRAVVSSLSCS